MRSYHSIIETMASLDDHFKGSRYNNLAVLNQVADIMSSEMEDVEGLMEKVEGEVTGVLLNLQEFITEESYMMLK